ncbi:hypothetical protein CRG98_005615 [Punica granatum]|uniref:Uncharacterized protein n=1 Tax=Punica granatum TaxID=22663 RepID=A0A2I0KZU3_PUNGR|nr:hypothetical protein CRG98_005615 [Punica granatum]
MGDLAERPDLHSMRREQERERRRMRDRERRQSMTQQEREKHLARRRKNYQLRRQKIKHFEIGYQSGPTGTASSGEIGERFKQQATPAASELRPQCKDIIPIGLDQVLQKINIEQSKSGGTESLAYDLAKLHRRLRLSHVKHFARSLKRPVCEFTGSSLQIVADLIAKGNPAANCKSMQGVRLNSIKRLARAVKNGSKETAHKQQQSETDGNRLH